MTIIQTTHGRFIGHTAATIVRRQYGRSARIVRRRILIAGTTVGEVIWVDGQVGR